ncbi:MAG: hypothetical protein GY877_08155 [Hyphomicrobium sp.]|nr:hypothetical protein [Hyphomicrobium sp.]
MDFKDAGCFPHARVDLDIRVAVFIKLKGTSSNGAFGFVGAGGAASGAVAMLVAALAAAFALPSGRLATPWTQLWGVR